MLGALLLVLLWANVNFAIPLKEYREQVKRALNSLELITQTEEGQSESQRAEFVSANVRAARQALPRTETVEWQGSSQVTDNSWLDDDLKEFERTLGSEDSRARLLHRILERLQALQERLEEADKGEAAGKLSKEEMQGRLAAILQRPEFGSEPQQQSAFTRLLRAFFNWLDNLLPTNSHVSPGRRLTISRIAQIFVVGLAVTVLAYVLRLFAPYIFRRREVKKKAKTKARIVLGERLEPDQSGADLLAEAEALARAGDLRAAIRKGYIALLVELGDRKVISLEQYKTNRDYLRSVREIEKLHGNMEKLTSSFEQHWYGLTPANENDWIAFHAFYRAALASS